MPLDVTIDSSATRKLSAWFEAALALTGIPVVHANAGHDVPEGRFLEIFCDEAAPDGDIPGGQQWAPAAAEVTLALTEPVFDAETPAAVQDFDAASATIMARILDPETKATPGLVRVKWIALAGHGYDGSATSIDGRRVRIFAVKCSVKFIETTP